jgi:ubiquinone/menaquinone biosynthesis C-methylase UbiE
MQQKITAAYQTLAEGYNRLIDTKPHNAYYDRPNTLSLFPDVAGKKILDAACGPGKYAEILMAAGAHVEGFDISPAMVALAKERNNGKGNFWIHNLADPLPMLNDESFDIVLCALAIHYLPSWEVCIKEFCRVLKPGGLLIISMEHPFNDYLYFKSNNYFATEPVSATWRGFGKPVEVFSYRRSLTDCMAPLTQNGFWIAEMLEPLPTKEFEKADARHFKELSLFPAFLCVRAVKK